MVNSPLDNNIGIFDSNLSTEMKIKMVEAIKSNKLNT